MSYLCTIIINQTVFLQNHTNESYHSSKQTVSEEGENHR